MRMYVYHSLTWLICTCDTIPFGYDRVLYNTNNYKFEFLDELLSSIVSCIFILFFRGHYIKLGASLCFLDLVSFILNQF